MDGSGSQHAFPAPTPSSSSSSSFPVATSSSSSSSVGLKLPSKHQFFRHPASPFATNRSHSPSPSTSSNGQPPTPSGRTTPRLARLFESISASSSTSTSMAGPSSYFPTQPRPSHTRAYTEAQASDVDFVDGAFATVAHSHTVTRPPSPSEFSFIEHPTSPIALALDFPPTHTPTSCFATPSRRALRSLPITPGSAQNGNGGGAYFASQHLGIGLHSYRLRTPSPAKGTLTRIWDSIALSVPRRTGSGRARSKGKHRHAPPLADMFDYSGMDPLDGEEGELIDEACFIDAEAVTGIDILDRLPPEIALYLFRFLDLRSTIACLSVSRTWRALAEDNAVWRSLFYARLGWRLDLPLAARRARLSSVTRPSVPRRLSLLSVASVASGRGRFAAAAQAPLMLDWREVYRTRLELDRRWENGEPVVSRLKGHTDSVYCLEFDSKRILTGSRDKTIKVWDLRSGELLGTFAGHTGSVLCLKFDKDWDAEHGGLRQIAEDKEGSGVESPNAGARKRKRKARPGYLVSGSSDCTIKVWDLHVMRSGEVRAEQKAVLKGHGGGVLDIKMDERWIVSCSKDAVIRVWDRATLELHCQMRGHEGPVNAVGLQSGRVVSASGDGKMMLWDVVTGKRLRTFDGHDRGLACIEFRGDYIISGSNDCKIKVWSASSGECVRTLAGHDLLVRALAFDPESGRLVSASYDKTLKVWDLHTGRLVREFRTSHASHIFDVKFDVCRIVSTSHDQKIVVHDFSRELDTTGFV